MLRALWKSTVQDRPVHVGIFHRNDVSLAMFTPNSLQSNRVAKLCTQYHVKSLSLFGSQLHGDSTPQSDIDLLVSFSKPISLFQLVALERQLSAMLGAKVDLLTEDSISPYLRKHILRERQEVYAA